MHNIVKLLLIPLVIIGVNSNNCYSTENNNTIHNNNHNINTINYNDQDISWEQWTKCANFEPIDVNGEEYKNICNFCEENKLSSLKCGIEGFLVDIYRLACEIVYSNVIEEKKNQHYKFVEMFSRDTICIEDINNMKIPYYSICVFNRSLLEATKQWRIQRKISDDIEQGGNIHATDNRYILEKKYNIMTNQLMLKPIVSNIRYLQKKLNSNKYLNNNDINNIQYYEKNIINMMSGCNCIANQLVQLTHDIVYAINNKINEYKKKNMHKEQLYEEFRKYLIDEITLPCFNTIELSLSLFIENDCLVLENFVKLFHNNRQIQEIATKFFEKLQHYWKYYFLIDTKCSLIYNFSYLGRELYAKNQEFINILDNSINEMNKISQNTKNDILRKCLLLFVNKSNVHVKDMYCTLVNFEYYYGVNLLRYIRSSTSNNNIINMANMGIEALNYGICDFEEIVSKMGKNGGHLKNEGLDVQKYYNVCMELRKKLKTINQYITTNIDYLSDIKYLFNKYKIKQENDGTYDISACNIDWFNNDGKIDGN